MDAQLITDDDNIPVKVTGKYRHNLICTATRQHDNVWVTVLEPEKYVKGQHGCKTWAVVPITLQHCIATELVDLGVDLAKILKVDEIYAIGSTLTFNVGEPQVDLLKSMGIKLIKEGDGWIVNREGS